MACPMAAARVRRTLPKLGVIDRVMDYPVILMDLEPLDLGCFH